jgi:hypothetical protein
MAHRKAHGPKEDGPQVNLSETRIRAARAGDKRYELQDGDGLILEVMPSGKKYWRYRYTQGEKRRKATIGEYPYIGLRDAREKRNEMRGQLRYGQPEETATFREIARQ